MKRFTILIFTVAFSIFIGLIQNIQCKALSNAQRELHKRVALEELESSIAKEYKRQQKEKKKEFHNPYTELIDNLTDYEKELVCRITIRECIDQELNGQRAVMEVIFNRVLGAGWPSTVEKVLSQKNQFKTWEIRHWPSAQDVEEMMTTLDIVRNATDMILPNTEYVYFATHKQTYAKNYIHIQGHYFGTSLDSDYVLTEKDMKDFYLTD